eukprot:m.52419 g.52419  ORF g.52419 m.52419 type:complete len:321 (-) comp11772_c0_seq1:25-987(-)
MEGDFRTRTQSSAAGKIADKSAAEASLGATHKGWLQKQGLTVKSWKLRWVVLQHGCLYYYENGHSGKSKGCFSLRGYSVAIDADLGKKFCFKLLPLDRSGRTWYFVTSTDQELYEWMEAMKKDIARFFPDDSSPAMPHTTSGEVSSDDDENYDEPYDDSMGLGVEAQPKRVSAVLPASRPFESPLKASSTPPVALPRPDAATAAAAPAAPRQRLVSASQDLTDTPWFYWGQERTAIEAVLQPAPHGDFVVRQKDSASPLVLSVKWNRAIKHYKIYFVEGSGFSVGGDCIVFFKSPMLLLRHYQKEPLPRCDVVLGSPFAA